MVRNQVKFTIWNRVRSMVWADKNKQVSNYVQATTIQVSEQIWDRVWSDVRAPIQDQVQDDLQW